MSKFVIGVVLSFGPAKKDRYGFVKVKGRKGDVFFSFDDGRGFVQESTRAGWSTAKVTRDPQKGDRLRLVIDTRRPRQRAKPWGFAEDAEAIEERMKNRVPA